LRREVGVFSTLEKEISPKEVAHFLPAKNLEVRRACDGWRFASGGAWRIA